MSTHAQREQGFTLIEAMIGVSILAITGVALWGLLNLTLDLIWETKAKTGASAIANQYMEIAHNLPYTDVGTVGGIPAGSIEPSEQKTLNNITYTIATSVIYEDDPFDGTLPADLLPADYKVVRVEVSWPFKIVSNPIVFVSKIAPKGIESEAGGGTIRITVLDALGVAVPQANVHIENTDISPTVDLNIVTDDNGQVLLPGALPSVEGYDVTVTKAGFSTDLTYEVDPVNLPTPIRPPLTVVEGTLTEATFSIDRTSAVIVSTINAGDSACEIAHTPPDDTTVRIAGVKTTREEVSTEEDEENITFTIAQTPTVNTYTVGSHSQNVNITSVVGTEPWTITFPVGTDLSNVYPNDKLVDEASPQKSWKVATVNDGADSITVEDSEGNTGSPNEGGPSQAVLSRWYATLASWESDRGGDLVTRNSIEQAELYADSDFTANATISGSITDASHYMWVTVPSSQRHNHVAGSGVEFNFGGNSISHGIQIEDDYTVAEWLELHNYVTGDNSAAVEINNADNVTLNNLLVHGYTAGSSNTDGILADDSSNLTITDSRVYQGSGKGINIRSTSITIEGSTVHTMGDEGIEFDSSSSGPVRNSIIYGAGDDGFDIESNSSPVLLQNVTIYGSANYGINAKPGTLVTATNVISMDNGDTDFEGTITQSYNLSSDNSASGTGSIKNKNAANQFTSLTSGSEDFHLIEGSDALDEGTDLSATFSDDYDDETRPIGSAWDIGADEAGPFVEIHIYVDGISGSDSTGDGTAGAPYQSITKGLQDFKEYAGGSLNIAGGQTYSEGSFNLNQAYSGTTSTPAIIRSWSGTATATVESTNASVFSLAGAQHIIFSRLAFSSANQNAVEIHGNSSNIDVEYSLISGNGGSGIRDHSSGGFNTYTNNTVQSNDEFGIEVNASDDITITGNIIFSNTDGINVTSGNSAIITGNTVYSNTSDGISVNGTTVATIQSNTIYSNTLNGLELDSRANTVLDNTITNNTNNGILISSDDNTIAENTIANNTLDGIFTDGTDGNIISSNTIHSNSNSGLDVINITSVTISNNTVYGNSSRGLGIQDNSSNVTTSGNRVYSNTTGIHVKSATSVTLQNNTTFSNSQYGIAVIGGSDDVQILSNTVAKNTIDGIALDQASTNTVITNNIIALNTGWGLTDVDNASEPTDAYNLFYSNTAGHMNNLTPLTGGTGTIIDTDPLFVNSGADNYYLQSVKGYYPFGPSDISAVYSPAIDAGDTDSTYTLEPVPNGCRINIGAFGNTAQASKSPEGGAAIPNIPFTMRGSKLIGWDSGGAPVYKYNQAHQTGGDGTITLADIEWDSYVLTIDEVATGYDIAYTNPYQPSSVLPNTSPTITLGLAPDSAYSSHVVVIDVDSDPIDNAQVRLYNLGISYDTTIVTPSHGQAFFSSLTNNTYTLEIGKENYTTSTQSVVVDDDVSTTVTLTLEGGSPPLTPPDAPTVTGFSGISEDGVTINWTDNANNEDGYRVYYNTTNSKPGSPQATLAANSITHPVSSLTCGTLYYWWIEAYNTAGSADHTGAPSQQSTSGCPTPPNAPTIQSFTGITETAMTINWADNSNDEDGFRIYRDTSSTKPGTPLTSLAADATSYDGTGMVCNTTYHWWVEAYNSQGATDDTASQITNACAPTEVFSDFFTEGSNTVLSSHAPNVGTGWTRLIEVTNNVENGGNSRIGVNGNNDQLRDNGWCGGRDGALYQTNDIIPGANYEVSVSQINGDTDDDYNILAARIQDANNLYAVKWNESDTRLYRRTSASGWETISSQVAGISDGSTVTLKVDGTTISVLDDSSTIISVADTTHSSAGRAGVGMGAVISNGDDCSGQKLDDFSVSTT